MKSQKKHMAADALGFSYDYRETVRMLDAMRKAKQEHRQLYQPSRVRSLTLPVALLASTVIASSAALWIARADRKAVLRTTAIKLVVDQNYEVNQESVDTVESWLTQEFPVSFLSVISSVFRRFHRLKPFGGCLFALRVTQPINGLSNFRDQIKSIFLGFNVLAVGIVKPGNKAFPRNLVLWMRKVWFHEESSFVGCRKQRMDDGGRRGNAPPNATYGKVAEKQSGVAV